MFIRSACSMAACLLLTACAMTPPQPVAQPPPFAVGAAQPVAVANVPAAPAPAASTMAPAAPVAMQAPAAQPLVPAPAASVASTPSAPVTAPVATPQPPEHRAHGAETRPLAMRKPKPARQAPATPSPTTLGALTGHIALVGSRGQSVLPEDSAQTLVYFVPASGNALPVPGSYTVFTHDRQFDPRGMAVPLGSTLKFTNLDDFRHNVYSVTPGSQFDLGYQASGTSASQTFTHAGLVLISCHVHHARALNLLVVPTRYATRLDA
ncbi:MAG: hypothetical protein ACREPH_11000 [Rhodanobacteraceae bacterium]